MARPSPLKEQAVTAVFERGWRWRRAHEPAGRCLPSHGCARRRLAAIPLNDARGGSGKNAGF